METITLYQRLEDLINNSDLEKCLEELKTARDENESLSEVSNEIILLGSRFNGVVKEKDKGTLTNEEVFAKIQAVSNSTLSFIQTNSDILKEIEVEVEAVVKTKEIPETTDEKIDYVIREFDCLLRNLSSREPKYEWLTDCDKFFEKLKLKWNSRRFQVAVMALVKSGKSTLLNSWIGNEYLPSASVAETMQITRIRHNPEKKIGILVQKNETIARGPDDVRSQLRQLNTNARHDEKQNESNEIILEVNITSLSDKDLNGYGFDLIDTPGSNEVGVPTLQAKIEEIAKSSDVIIYLLDYTKLKTNEEQVMFTNLSTWRKELFEQFKNRLFFVVNKIDESNRHDEEKQMTKDKIKGYVKDIIYKATDFDLDASDIILVSSEQALLGRLVQNDLASERQLRDYKKITFGEVWSKRATPEQCLEAVPELLSNSGFAELEEKVLSVIHKKRVSIFLSSIFDDFNRLLEQLVINNLDIGKATLMSDGKVIDTLKEKIDRIETDFRALTNKTYDFQKKAQKLIQTRLHTYYNEIDSTIEDAFSDTSGARPRFPWLKAITDATIGPMGTTYIIIDNNHQALLDKLQLINDIVVGFLRKEYFLVWNGIIDDQYLEYIKLKENLTKEIKPIIRQIEQAINESLNIELHPQEVQYEKPTLQDFYHNTRHQISTLVDGKAISNMNPLESIFNKFLNLFGFGKKETFKSEFKINSKKYSQLVKESLAPSVNSAENLANQIVKIKYMEAIDRMKSDLNYYIKNYIGNIENEIKMKQRGIVDIPARIENMESDIISANETLSTLKKIRKTFKEL